MIKKEKIPTILGLLFLIAGIAIGVFLVKNRQFFKLGATATISPKDVRISNISDSSFTVSWTTDNQTVGFIKWGKTANNLNKTENDSISQKGNTHSVNIRSLTPQTEYYFQINSDGANFDNGGAFWQVKTGSILPEPGQNIIASGNVVTETGVTAKNTLVYITVGGGSPLSTVTSQNGSWLIPISPARNKTLNSYIPIDQKTTLLEISVNAGPLGVASAQIYPQSAQPTPAIILGNVNDFKNLPPSENSQIPKATIEMPEDEIEATSGFNVNETPSSPSSNTVTLDSIDEGEVITTTGPEFFGTGPIGTSISITIESEPITDDTLISSTGNWKWSPPADLEEGTHKITITWRDINGILRKITRNFIVQAAESPAFVSTPSATPTQTPSLTPTSTPISTSTASTTPEQPDSGSLTPTLLLFIMGIGTLLFGFLLWKNAEI